MMKETKKSFSKILPILTLPIILGIGILLGQQMGNAKETTTTQSDSTSPTPTVNQVQNPTDADDDPFMGSEDAPITMIEFSDYQCPFCRSFFNETLPLIKENYIDKGLVKLVYRDMPLTSLGHTDATPAANAAECARDQGGDEVYFAYHDLIFEGENKLGYGTVKIPEESLYTYAEQLGLDADQFKECQEGQKYYDEIAEDSAAGRAAGMNGTPSFVINGQLVIGAYPYETFEQIFNELLK
ncbi:MAG: DsbA family protein [Patescibacteria group bacterium]|jgi:protein-disulfide isomerase